MINKTNKSGKDSFPNYSISYENGKIVCKYLGPKLIEKELDIPRYPKELEDKVLRQQKIKRIFFFYSALNKSQKRSVLFALIVLTAFFGILLLKPAITGLLGLF